MCILGLYFLITVVIALFFLRAGVDPMSAEYVTGARQNGGAVWSLAGFLVYYGVQSISTTYPLALSFGNTRYNFVGGTMIANLMLALYVALASLLLLGVELATNHWFIGVYAFDVDLLGAGNPAYLFSTMFLGTWLMLTIGGAFAAVWVRFGSRGVTIAIAACVVVLCAVFLLIAPNFIEIVSGLTRSVLAAIVLGIIAVSLVGTWFAVRRAAVR